MECIRDSLPSGWEKKVLEILTSVEARVHPLNDLYGYRYHYPDGLMLRIADAATGEMIAGWQTVAEDVCSRIF